MYSLAHINDIIEPARLAITMDHHIPIIPKLKTNVDIRASNIVSTIVLNRVAISAYIPFPVPWNIADDDIPNAADG